MRKVISSLLLGLTFSGQLMSMEINAARCNQWGNSLNASQAAHRWLWAKRCDKKLLMLKEIDPDLLPKEDAIDHNGKRRKIYPVYAMMDGNGNPTNPANYRAPVNKDAACNIPDGYKIAFLCFAGCYTPSQKVSFLSGDKAIGEAASLKLKDLKTFAYAPEGDLVELNKPVKRYISSILPGDHAIYEIETEFGKRVEVTPEHPLIKGDSTVMAAKTLVVGDKLLGVDGPETITSIKEKNFYGKVHNIEVDTKKANEKIFVAEGLYSADVTFQNENDILLGQLLSRLYLIEDQDVL